MTGALTWTLDDLRRQAACSHTQRSGGNDYLECRDCGLTWDYRKVGPEQQVVNNLLAYIAAAAPPPSLTQAEIGLRAWQPIETAPKDGTRFIGGCHHKTYGWTWSSCRFYDDDKYGLREPYAVMDGGGKPTHWCPVPLPPDAALLLLRERIEPHA